MNNKSIFHYTKDYSTICRIIEEGFAPSFCIEQICTTDKCIKFSVPMISFCDITLSKADEHKNKYGKFAIGVKKDWAIKNNINPIYYLNIETGISNSIVSILNAHSNYIKTCDEKNTDFEMLNYIKTVSHFKNYKGDINPKLKNITFYDEKEWRYVPVFKNECGTESCKIFTEEKFEEIIKTYPHKPHFRECALKIKLSDITHIVVPDKKSKYDLINCLSSNQKISNNKNNFNDLLTKILTYKEIVYDL